MNQYRFRKSTPIVSKLQLADKLFYATVVDHHPTIHVFLTKNQIDLEQLESFFEQLETLRQYNPEQAKILSDSFLNYEQNHDLIATITGVVNEETAGELLLNSRYGEDEVPVLHINWVGSSPYYSGNRFGVLVMYVLAKYCMDTKNIQYITLDDDTDVLPIDINHNGKVDNIYYLIGFKHKGKIGRSEYWKKWNPGNATEGPERIISISEFMNSREITQIQNMYKTF
jgi:predicted GH43/DUF377 family glycosyl hydrolase